MNSQLKGSSDTDDLLKVSAELSKADMQLSKAEIDLSKAEASAGKLEAAWVKSAIVAIIGLGGAVVYGLWILIVALRDDFRYKKHLKEQNNA